MVNKCPKCGFENPEDTFYCGKCATPLPSSRESGPLQTETLQTPVKELATGSTFAGRYQIIEELGKGGMGKVYKANDTDIKEKVAIKLIKPEISTDKKTIERFQNEIKFARKIRHKNVCQMYDLNKEEGTYYITMEYVSGEDLKSFIRRSRQLAVGTAITIAKQVCEGLSEAHKSGVVHRDLKPGNIMIDNDGNARIMDFGIARSLEGKGITGAGVMIGTPEYMSPEQVEGKEVDQRSDIYSLGVILYEMVTGHVPFEGDTPFTVGIKHKSEIPRDPKELNTQIPEDLSRVILKCLEKDKDARYQSAGEVHAELSLIEKGIPTSERKVPVHKPLTSKEITVQFSVKKIFVPAFIFAAVVIIGVIIWQVLPKKAPAPIPTDKPSLAVMYFENNTGDLGLEHYRKALSDLLIADLSQSKYIRVLRGDSLYNILDRLGQLDAKSYSSEVLKAVAERGRVNHILQGNYTRAGEKFRINIMLHDAKTEELIASESVEGVGEASIFSMVDKLTKKLKASFNLSRAQIASDLDKDIWKITTSSPEAYRYYSEAQWGWGDYKKSIELLKTAVEIDPEFAMAYRALATCYSNLNLYAERSEYIQKALELADRLPDQEKYLIQGDFYSESEKTYDKAIEAYTKLLELYPDHATASNNLGLRYRIIGELDKAIERYRAAVESGYPALVFYTNLASVYRAKGWFDKATEVLESWSQNFSPNVGIHRALATTYRQQGEFDLALAELDKAFLLDPTNYTTIRFKGYVYFDQGDLEKAEEEYRKLLRDKEPLNAYGFTSLAGLYSFQGRFQEAKEHAKKALEIARKHGQDIWIRGQLMRLAFMELRDRDIEKAWEYLDEAWDKAVEDGDMSDQRGVLWRKGYAYVVMKSLDDAQRMADEYRKMCDASLNKRLIQGYHHLQARIELARENYSRAIEHLNKASSLLYANSASHVILTDLLALAYYESGDLEKARTEYEKISTFHFGKSSYGETYTKSYYQLGKVCEQLGDNVKATENYQKFLDIWKNADPGQPEVDDARKRLAGLSGA